MLETVSACTAHFSFRAKATPFLGSPARDSAGQRSRAWCFSTWGKTQQKTFCPESGGPGLAPTVPCAPASAVLPAPSCTLPPSSLQRCQVYTVVWSLSRPLSASSHSLSDATHSRPLVLWAPSQWLLARGLIWHSGVLSKKKKKKKECGGSIAAWFPRLGHKRPGSLLVVHWNTHSWSLQLPYCEEAQASPCGDTTWRSAEMIWNGWGRERGGAEREGTGKGGGGDSREIDVLGQPPFTPISCCSWRRKWQSTPVFLPGKSHGQRSLAGYCPLGRKESDMTEVTAYLLLYF